MKRRKKITVRKEMVAYSHPQITQSPLLPPETLTVGTHQAAAPVIHPFAAEATAKDAGGGHRKILENGAGTKSMSH